MIINGMRADELVNDPNLIGNPNATNTWYGGTGEDEYFCDYDLGVENEYRTCLVKVANTGESEATRLHARLLLLRASYREAREAGRPLGQLVAQGKQVARRLASMGVRV